MTRKPIQILVYQSGYSCVAVAEALGIDKQKATRMIRGEQTFPACFVLPLSKLTGIPAANILAAVATDADTLSGRRRKDAGIPRPGAGRPRKPRPTTAQQEQP